MALLILPPPVTIQACKFDVFLTFKGADTTQTFTGHLDKALRQAGFHTFLDDAELSSGEIIRAGLKRAIEESRIDIIVFSENYASSGWCLYELARIIERKKEKEGCFAVFPVFYKVDPADVRRQTGSFAAAFQKHEARYANELAKVHRWRSALRYAADLSGFTLQDFNGCETELVKEIVNKVQSRGDSRQMSVAQHPVGLDSRDLVTIQAYKYDVFLTFKGADTRQTFTGHLDVALRQAGFHTFLDDDELSSGENIRDGLTRGIEESRIAIIVFSENYASSGWCLYELERIIERKKEKEGCFAVFPVFYKVDPADVRRQTGSFAAAFQKHEARYANEPDKVQRWRSALRYAADLSGFTLQGFNGHEAKLVKEIVNKVRSRGDSRQMFVAIHPVGLHSQDLVPLLNFESKDVRLTGIYGMGGIGKTVLAKALFNGTLGQFESSCFLADIRDHSAQRGGLVSLQEKLLYEVLMKRKVKVGNVHAGIRIIKERCKGKKVLVVLDDLDDVRQANALGARDCYGPGSRIIITTRDRHLLEVIGVDELKEVTLLTKEESRELFSLHSFGNKSVPADYAVLSEPIIDYCEGLPLALVVIGSYLYKRSIAQWRSVLEKLQQYTDNDIDKVLKISYDGLDKGQENGPEKAIFLDIACFFIGMDKDYVTSILDGCGLHASIGIDVLIERCLLTVDSEKELRMHNLLRDMGREIIRRPFPTELGKRSRLWFHQDATNVLKGKTGTEAVEGVKLVVPPNENEIKLSTRNFKRICYLRLLQMDYVHLEGSFGHLSKSIKWIHWQNCRLNNLPSELDLSNLVALDLQKNNMRAVWQNIQFLQQLKIINFSHSRRMSSTPDFTKVPKLETLILEGCTNLGEIHPSIGCLAKLVFLNLQDCKKIKNLPTEICNLRSLRHLDLNGCSNLQGLPENLGYIESLSELFADETRMDKLPSSLGQLRNLTNLSLKGCKRTSAASFFGWFLPHDSTRTFLQPSTSEFRTVLRRLILRDLNLTNEEIPDDIGSLSALEVLDLAGNKLSRLPTSFIKLINIHSLWLDDWKILQPPAFSAALPSNLRTLMTENLRKLAHSSSSIGDSSSPRYTDRRGPSPRSYPMQTSRDTFPRHDQGMHGHTFGGPSTTADMFPRHSEHHGGMHTVPILPDNHGYGGIRETITSSFNSGAFQSMSSHGHFSPTCGFSHR